MASTEIERQEKPLDAATMELVITSGDLSKLNPAQRVSWYRARCEAAGLDPRTQPFQYLQLQGKLTLYATKAATDQLIASRRLTVQIVERRHDQALGVYEVQCRVIFPDNRSVEDFAALPVKGLAGDQLCNALMKCVTKAKRRTVLSACGLGMLDETEIETIPNAQTPAHHAVNHDNGTGHGVGAYPKPEVVEAYQSFLNAVVSEINQKWLDRITDKQTGEMLSADGEIVDTGKLSRYLLDWAKGMDWVKAPLEVRVGQRDKFAAVAWEQHMDEFMEETRRFFKTLWNAALKKIKASKPSERRDGELEVLAAQDEVLDSLATTEAGSRG